MSRPKNPEIYVKGYGKNIEKDDLKSWFRDFGKIVCIQYKGPYSFIVLFSLFRSFKTTMMQNQQSNRWMTKRWKDTDSLLSLPVKKRIEVAIVKGAIAASGGTDIAEEGKIKGIIALPLQAHHPHPHQVVLSHLHQALLLQSLKGKGTKKTKDDDNWFK